MQRIFCPQCRLEQPADYLYCPRCGVRLPLELLQENRAKAVRFFAGIKVDPGDLDSAFLRVSSYRQDQRFETSEGPVTVPGHHVRFSIWVGAEALCVISLPESEARDLAEFLFVELSGLGARPASDDLGSVVDP
jgi:hypothetical protein